MLGCPHPSGLNTALVLSARREAQYPGLNTDMSSHFSSSDPLQNMVAAISTTYRLSSANRWMQIGLVLAWTCAPQ